MRQPSSPNHAKASSTRVLHWRLPNGRRGKSAAMPAEVVAETLRLHRARPNGIALWAVDVER